MRTEGILRRRRGQRSELLALAREFVDGLDPALGIRAAVVIGSVARGDFNVWSDVDVLIVADALETDVSAVARLEALGTRPPLVQPIAWTSAEWGREVARRNPMAVEALERGVWLLGSPAGLRR